MKSIKTNLATIKMAMRGALVLMALSVYGNAVFAQAGSAVPGTAGYDGSPFPGTSASPGASLTDDPEDAFPEQPFYRPPLSPGAPEPSADPRNFDGAWYHPTLMVQISNDMYGRPTPLNAKGRKVLARRIQSSKDGKPFINASARCIPVGPIWQLELPQPFHIFQSKDRFEFLFEEFHGYMQIAMDPAKAPPPGYMGRSIAHWDGNTLVVETSDFKQDMWLDINGTPVSKNAKLTQRIRKTYTDHWLLSVENTLDDPTYFKRPWSWATDYAWRPDMNLNSEYDCEYQTGMKNGLDATLVPEPRD